MVYVCDSSDNCMATGETVKVEYIACPKSSTFPTITSSATITWSTAPNATGYFVYRSTDNVSFFKIVYYSHISNNIH